MSDLGVLRALPLSRIAQSLAVIIHSVQQSQMNVHVHVTLYDLMHVMYKLKIILYEGGVKYMYSCIHVIILDW